MKRGDAVTALTSERSDCQYNRMRTQIRAAAGGVMGGMDGQLAPDGIEGGALGGGDRAFSLLTSARRDLAAVYLDVQRERRERQQAGDTMADRPLETPRAQQGRRLAGEFEQLAAMRAVLSERQLYEVVVDFWTNHFNVYVAKAADRFLAPDYIEHTIRPPAPRRFADLP